MIPPIARSISNLFVPNSFDILWKNEEAMEFILDGVLYTLTLDEQRQAWVQRSYGEGPRISLQELLAVGLGTGQSDDRARHLAAIINTGASLS